MNKAELIRAIASETGLLKATVENVLEAQGRIIASHLANCDANAEAEAVLPGLGKLKTTTRAARTGRNPQTGESIEIPERVAVNFHAGKYLADGLNP